MSENKIIGHCKDCAYWLSKNQAIEWNLDLHPSSMPKNFGSCNSAAVHKLSEDFFNLHTPAGFGCIFFKARRGGEKHI